MSIGDGVSGWGRGSPSSGSDELAEIERKVRQGRDLRNWEGGELLGEIARLHDENSRLTAEVMRLRDQLERARAVACQLEAEQHKRKRPAGDITVTIHPDSTFDEGRASGLRDGFIEGRRRGPYR